jgi:hypothetical protein
MPTDQDRTTVANAAAGAGIAKKRNGADGNAL